MKTLIQPRLRSLRALLAVMVMMVAFRAVDKGWVAPSITSLSPTSGPVGTTVTITGANFVTDLLVGKIGWWGPFQSGVVPRNLIVGKPNGVFAGTPTFTADGGGAFISNATNYLDISDGGAGGTYDWTAGPWSAQVDFMFPATPVFPPEGILMLVSKGSFAAGTGWEIQINNSAFNGKYQLQLESNHGINSYNIVATYSATPGLFHRAVIVYDGAGTCTWYVNGSAANPQACTPPSSGVTHLLVGRYSDIQDYAAGFPISRVQIWNRTLTPAEAVQTTTTDPIPHTVTFNGTAATPTTWGSTSIVAPVPAGATSGPVIVSVGGQPSNGVTYSVGAATPTITTLTPALGAVGTSVTIAGANFGATQGTSTVRFNGTTATPTSWSAGSIVVPVPAGATTGSVVVTVGAQASNGVTFTVAPSITGLSPASGPVGTAVTITGANFGATQGTSGVQFNGTTATPTSWTATSIVVPVPSGATTGNVVVGVGTQSSNGVNFVVTVPPVIATLAPMSATVGSAVTITGTGFGATQGTSTVTFNGTAATPTTWSATSIAVPVPAGATTGPVVVTAAGLPSNGVIFTVITPPSITSLTPTSGIAGTAVTIAGANFGATQGTSTITFNGTTATPTTWSATSILVPVPAAATTGPVVVTVGTLPSNGVTFTVALPPSITTLSPTSGAVGTPVTIAGANFGATQGTSTVRFNGTTATPTSWSATSILVPVPSGALSGNVVVTVSGLPSTGVPFTVAPSITTLSPTSGAVGAPVTITGLNFGTTQGTGTVSFNGTAATPTTWSATSIVAPVPSGATTGNVVVTAGGLPSNGVSFSVTPPPGITSLSPTSGGVGVAVTIAGANFGATQGTSTVRFNGTIATPTTWSATSILVPVPAGASTGPVVVNVGGQPSNGVSFTVPPNITSLSPAVGAAGAAVTIAGANFGATVGTSTVTFNGTAAIPTSWSATSITVPVPAGAATGPVVVTVSGLPSNGATFTVPPAITNVSPAFGAAGTPVSIAGTNFAGTQGTSTVRFNGMPAAPTTWSDVNIVVPVPNGATTGNIAVTVDGQSSNAASFTVPPGITSLTPASGGVGSTVTISGANFGATQGSSTVTFNGAGATPTSWSATSIAVTVPLAATSGNVVVTVGSLPSNGANFTLTVPPSITSLSPVLGPIGTAVTIAGADFGAIQGTSTVRFNGTTASPISWSATSVTVPVPAGATTGPVVLTVNSQPSNGVSFTVAPTIASLSPLTGPGGAIVTISGTNFGATQGTSTVSFNGTPATPTSWSVTTIVVPVPAGSTTGNVVITVGGQPSNGVVFTVPPAITTLSPASGPIGAAVTITGTNFGSTQGTSTVTFNATAATPTIWTATSITVPVPAGAITGPVVVTVGSLPSNGATFTVTAAPTITSLTPALGAVGAAVTIAGTNFGATQGTSTVRFNGTTATPTSWSATSLVVPVPAGGTTGDVVVTVGGQPSNGVGFTVAPSITTLSPTSGGVGATVTVTGVNFGAIQGTSTVRFNGTTASPISWSATSISVPVPTGAVTGPVVVTVGTQASNGVTFTVTPTASGVSIWTSSTTPGPMEPDDSAVELGVKFQSDVAGSITGLKFYKYAANTGTHVGNLWSPTETLLGTVTFINETASGWQTAVFPTPINIAANTTYTASYHTNTGNYAATQSGLTAAVNNAPLHALASGASGGNGAYSYSATSVYPSNTWNASNYWVDVVFTSAPTAPPPAITSLTPVSGAAATAVTIAGTNFGATQGTSTVRFNGTTATVTTWSATSITAPVPAGATTGNVVVTVGGQASNGVLFTVPPSITSLTPTAAPVGGAITIAGANFGGTQGTSTVRFNGTLTTPTSWSATSLTVPVPVGATTGPVVVTVGTLPSNGVTFTVTPPPGITTLTPAVGAAGTAVTIAGTNFGATQGTSTVRFNGTTATPTTWTATSIAVPVPAGASTGNVVVTVGGQASNGAAFTVPPAITSLSPAGGAIGASITIAGTNFGATQGTSTLTFNGTAATPASWNPTSITAVVPGGATTGPVVVTVGGLPSNGVTFSVTLPPSISTVSPASGAAGTPVTIAGANFGATQGTSTVRFNGTTATPTTWSGTSITVPVPAGASTGNVVVTVGGQASNGAAFAVPPVITSLSPAAAIAGTPITIAGGDFGATQAASTVTFNGTAATPTSWSAASIVVPVPAGATTGPVVVTVNSLPSNSATFTVAPSIATLSPTAGVAGTGVTITGANFGATQGASTVRFNGTTATPTTWSATSIAVPVPAGASTGNVVVTVSSQASNGVGFTVPPSITSLSPTAAAVGAAITITGANFGATQGASAVTFNGTPATPTTWGAASISVTVPAGATTGPVVVTVGGLPSNGAGFTVTPPPSIAGLSPASGAVGASVTISGADFGATQGTSTVRFNGTAATPTSWSATSIVVPVPAAATTGPVSVTVGGLPSNGVVFTVSPSITSLSPTSAIVGTAVTITGANFGATQGASTVTFNGTPATPTSWSAASIVVPVPVGAATGPVVVTANTLASNGVTFTVVVPPSITNLSPASGAVGVPVTITGTNFGATQGTSTVQFNGTTATPTTWSATSIVVPVPAGATPGPVVVTVAGLPSNGASFTVPPSITSLSPAAGQVGAVVTIAGANFGATQGLSTVTFNGTAATPTSWTGTSVVVPVPSGATTGNVVVTVGGLPSNGMSFTVVTGPAITSLAPAAGWVGMPVTVTGANFGTSSPPAAIAVDANVFTDRATAATTVAVTALSTTSPNELLLAFVSADDLAGTNITVTGVAGGSLTWTLVRRTNTQKGTSEIWRAFATTPLTNVTVTATLSKSVLSSMTIMSFTGADPTGTNGAGAIGATGSGNGNPGAPTATLITTRNNSWVVGVGNDFDNDVARTLGPNQTMVHQYLAPVNATFWVQRATSAIPVSGTSVTINDVGPTTDRYNLTICEILPAPSGGSTITFNGTAATPTSWSPTSIVAPVPAGATNGNVVVTVAGNASNGVGFTVTPPPPSITTLTPAAAGVGTAITIAGVNFGATQGTSTVTFNGTVATPTTWSATSIAVPVPVGASTGNVIVTVAGMPSNGIAFTVIPPPSITTLSPTSGATGAAVTITGLNFGATQGTSTVQFNGTAATPTTWTATTIVVPVPTGATTGAVVVTVAAMASNGVTFTVAPSITTLTPTAAPVGAVVTIAGLNFGATQGTSTVRFNGTLATPTTWSTTSIAVPVPTGATTGAVVVTVGGLASNGVTFTVGLPPTITTLSPNAGTFGVPITITGTNFGATIGTSTVRFNGTLATPTTWSNTSILVPVPAAATTGTVVVTVNGIASNAVAFTVSPPPAITTLTPNAGAAGTAITITGTSFGATKGTSTVRLNALLLTPTTWSATSIVAPVPDGAITGPVTVLVGTQTSNAVTLTVPAPTITTLSPDATAVGNSVVINGSDFGVNQGTSVVRFNGTVATTTNWTQTSVRVVVPIGATTGPVVVTASGGQVSNGVVFTVTAPPVPTITSLSPTSGPVGTPVTITGTNLASEMLTGKIGWWGPFQSGVAPNNKMSGRPDAVVVGNPTYTPDGGGAIVSTGADYLRVPDGGAGGTYDWTSGQWSAQVDFAFPTTPVWGGVDHFLLVSKGSFNLGTGWEVQINNQVFNGKYQLQLESNHGVGNAYLITSYAVVPGAFHRALFVCNTSGTGTWYVNGIADIQQACGPSNAGASDLIIGKYSAPPPDHASNFPITRVQIWNRALTPAEAVLATTTDPSPSTVTFNGTSATPTSFSPTSIIAPVPAAATTGPVVVTAAGQPSNGVDFTVTTALMAQRSSSQGSSTLSGAVSPTPDAAGATVSLGGAATATTTVTDAGLYTFPELSDGTYAVRPSKPGYTFTPPSRIVTVTGAAVGAVDFTAAPASSTYTISGSISPATSGAGATIALTGTDRTATADSSGTFTFEGVASGTYTALPSKSGYVFGPASLPVTVTDADVRIDFTAAMGATADRANSYDNAWKSAWIDHARALLKTPGKTAGFVLEIGDAITRSQAYAMWPAQGQGQTVEDSQTLTWARAAAWGTGNTDATSKNGWYLAATDATALRGLSASSGLSAVELVSGCCNGGPAMPASGDAAAARQILGSGSYPGNLQIDTLISAFHDAQFAVVMLGTSDPGNPDNVAALTSIIDKLEAQHIVPILTTIPPRNDAIPNALNMQFNSAVRALAQARSLPLIDFYQEIVLRRPGSTWFGTLISADGVEPTASGAGFSTVSNPYVPGGDPATLTTGDAAMNVGYLLRSWLTVQKLREVKQYVVDGSNPQF